MAKDYAVLARELAVPLADSLGLTVWGIDFVAGSRPTLRIFVEKSLESVPTESAAEAEGKGADISLSQGVSVDDCAELSRLLGLSLDVDDTFEGAWTLEVSSPGLERIFFSLDQMRPYVGREIDVVLRTPHAGWPVPEGMPGRKRFRGMLQQVGEDGFILAIPEDGRLASDPETAAILWADVRRTHLVHEFQTQERPSGPAGRKGAARRNPGQGSKKSSKPA